MPLDLLNTNAYEALSGVRELAELTGLTLGAEPTLTELDELMKAWGKASTYATNAPEVARRLGIEGNIPSPQVLELLRKTGAFETIDMRTLLRLSPPSQLLDTVVIVPCGVADWTEARINELERQWRQGDLVIKQIYFTGSALLCGPDTELSNGLVQRFQEGNFGALPTELQVAEQMVGENSGFSVEYVQGKGTLEQQMVSFAEAHPEHQGRFVYVPTNPNALSVPLMVRRALRTVWPHFDNLHDQLWFSQPEGRVAVDQGQWELPHLFHRPLTVFPALARLVWELHSLHHPETAA